MRLTVANYRKGTGIQVAPFRLNIVCDDPEWVAEHFGERRLRCTVGSQRSVIAITPDRSSAYRWGQVDKDGRQTLAIVHNSKGLKPFGVTEVNHHFEDDTLIIELPDQLTPPQKRKRKSRKASENTTEPTITLRQAVEAVNGHKRRLGDELCLSIDGQGELRALIEY